MSRKKYRNISLNERRGELRRQRRAAVALEAAPTAEDPYARKEAADTLHRLMATLDEDRRAAFILADVEGLTAVEIAEALQTNVNTIYGRLRAARQRFARLLRREQARDNRREHEG